MTDTYRKVYAPLTAEQKIEMKAVKTKAEELEMLYNDTLSTNADPRLIATAKTYLEISVMLAVKGITVPKTE